VPEAVWIGGSTCSGKSSVAERVAHQRGYGVYHCDVHEHELIRDVGDAHPTIQARVSRSLDDTWVGLSVDELVDESLQFFRELFPLLLEDVRRSEVPLVVEGHQLLPELLAPSLTEGDEAVWLVATLPFRLERHFHRPHAWSTPRKTRDPELAQAHRLERDARIAEIVRDQALTRGLRVIDVDGSASLDAVVADVESGLARSS
jgi:2-phosphoglycerate kinase